jgi:hypothetical protein
MSKRSNDDSTHHSTASPVSAIVSFQSKVEFKNDYRKRKQKMNQCQKCDDSYKKRKAVDGEWKNEFKTTLSHFRNARQKQGRELQEVRISLVVSSTGSVPTTYSV